MQKKFFVIDYTGQTKEKIPTMKCPGTSEKKENRKSQHRTSY